jgi:hypothetical protein
VRSLGLLLCLLGSSLAAQAAANTAYLNRYATPNDGLDDTVGLRTAINEADVVIITPGRWDFDAAASGPLVDGEWYEFQRCRIIGPADESGAQHQEEGRTADRYVSQLRITGLDPGEYWINWVPPQEEPEDPENPDAVDRGGPMEFSDTSVCIVGEGCFANYGDSGAGAGALWADLRVLNISGLYVTAIDQVASGEFDGVTLPDYAQFSMLRINRGYDTRIRDIGFQGGGVQLDLHGCDRARVDGFHGINGVTGLVSRNLVDQATVPNALTDIFVEGHIGTAIFAVGAQCDMLRTESGYDHAEDIGLRTVTDAWTITSAGSRVDFATIDARQKFTRGQVVRLNADTHLIVNEVDADGFTFFDAASHCYFENGGSGASVVVFDGMGVVGYGDRLSIGQWSVDYNQAEAGLPVGAFLPQCTTMPIGPWINGQSDNMDATNRAIIVGHCMGAESAIEASVHFAETMMAPDETHPLNHPGIGPVPDRDLNGWTSIRSSDGESTELRFRRFTGIHQTTGLSTTHWAVTPADSDTGYTLPAADSYSFEVYSTGAGTLSIYPGFGSSIVHPVVAGWQTVSDDDITGGTATTLVITGAGCSVKVERTDD